MSCAAMPDMQLRHAELKQAWKRAQHDAATLVLRTFLDAFERSNVDCRELEQTNWVGRSPRLGSIMGCRPEFVVVLELLHLFPNAAKPGPHLDQKCTLYQHPCVTMFKDAPFRSNMCCGNTFSNHYLTMEIQQTP